MHVKQERPFRHGIRFKLVVAIGALILALMIVDSFWNTYLQQQQSEREALEKAEVLAAQMGAAWDFFDMNQDVINRAEDGSFRTKTLVCVVAAKSVSTLFISETDYTIRFTNPTPRQVANTPDAFEEQAFEAFEADNTLESFYGIETNEAGERVFRYIEPLYVTESCLECHGEPVGELDQYGYAKEGMQVGDIGGAMSIIEPMDIYANGVQISVVQQGFMVLLVLAAACIGVYFAVSRLILRPLDKLGRSAKQIEEGNFDYELKHEDIAITDEVTEFIYDFNRMSQRLEQLRTNLESEVRIQTVQLSELNDVLVNQKAELSKALEKLSEESAYKNEFFTIMSHELRTPLTSILAFAKILSSCESLDESLDSETRDAIEEIEANANILLNMVNNILVISKVEAYKNELILEPVDFVDLLNFVKSSLEPLAKNKNITFTARTAIDVPLVLADWEKLRRILENLVDNAIKYTHPEGFVKVWVSFDEADEGTDEVSSIIIEVSDDGIGIKEEDQDAIFDLYQQTGQSAKRRYRGTGLGLAVVKELTELHGGTVSVVSTRQVGSVFTVKIPYVPVDEEEWDEDTAC